MLISFIKSLRHKAYIALFRALPIENNKIICWSNNLKAYGCSPKYITEYIAEHYPMKYDIVWAFNEETEIPDDMPQNVRTVRYFSIDYLRELHTAKIIITNARIGKQLFWKKRKGQFYIQTWHSSLRLKKIEGDAGLPQSYIDTAIKDSKNIDLLISGCDFSTGIFRNSFWYNGEIMKCGTPRCDMFFGDTSRFKNKVCDFYGIPKDRHIVLYAPTFRNNYVQNDLGLDYARLKSSLENKFGGEYCVLFRFHPNVVLKDEENRLPDWLINATKYSDMQELLCACDMLITDYSSCMFDAAVADKPCLLFAPDIDDYIKRERGLYFDIKKLPFPIAVSNDELDGIISSFDGEVYRNKADEFLKSVGSYEDGKAAERVYGVIEKECFNTGK